MGSKASQDVIPNKSSSGVISVPSPCGWTKSIVKLHVTNGEKIILFMNTKVLKFPAIRSC